MMARFKWYLDPLINQKKKKKSWPPLKKLSGSTHEMCRSANVIWASLLGWGWGGESWNVAYAIIWVGPCNYGTTHAFSNSLNTNPDPSSHKINSVL